MESALRKPNILIKYFFLFFLKKSSLLRTQILRLHSVSLLAFCTLPLGPAHPGACGSGFLSVASPDIFPGDVNINIGDGDPFNFLEFQFLPPRLHWPFFPNPAPLRTVMLILCLRDSQSSGLPRSTPHCLHSSFHRAPHLAQPLPSCTMWSIMRQPRLVSPPLLCPRWENTKPVKSTINQTHLLRLRHVAG